MELRMTNGFCEMSQNEMEATEGGVAPFLVFLGKAAVAGICWGLGYVAMDKILD